MKRPAFQFYPADWRKDVELQSCSMAAQGLWINCMCIAHECEPYGHLTINGKAMTPAQLGRQVGLPARECETLLAELLDAGVARKTDEGVIYSKRMVDDERLRNIRADGGKGGSLHGAKGGEHGIKGGRPKATKGGLETPLKTPLGPDEKPPLKPPPSSSSSTSVNSVPNGTDGDAVKPADADEKTAEELTRVELWAAGKSLLAEQGMPAAQCGSFVGKLVKDHGETVVIEAVRATVVARPADAATYLKAACQQRKKATTHTGFSNLDYREGVAADGSLIA